MSRDCDKYSHSLSKTNLALYNSVPQSTQIFQLIQSIQFIVKLHSSVSFTQSTKIVKNYLTHFPKIYYLSGLNEFWKTALESSKVIETAVFVSIDSINDH